MKKMLFIGIMCLGAYVLKAQQIYSNRVDQYLYNPSLGANTDALKLQAVYRSELGAFVGHPENYLLCGSTPLKDQRVGMGFKVAGSKIGFFAATDAEATFIYRFPISTKENPSKVSFGLSGTWTNYKIDREQIKMINPIDPVYMGDIQNASGFNANVGVSLYQQDVYHIGIAGYQLVPAKFQFNDVYAFSNQRPMFFVLTGGYVFNFENENLNKFDLALDAVAIATQKGLYQYKGMATVRYDKQVWLGGGFTSYKTFAWSMGLNFQNMSFAYSYGRQMNALAGLDRSRIHEIVLTLLLKTSKSSKQ